MASIANDTLPVLALFAPAFTPATFTRVQLLVVACLLTTGRRTITNLLRLVRHLAPGSSSSYHRVLSQAPWSGLRLAALLTRFLVLRFWPAGPIPVLGDDTVDEHRGKQVYGKARHRDPVRSSKKYTAYRYGHKWVALTLLIRFPFASRPWALPVLVALYRSPEDNQKRHRPHKTPAQLMRLLLRILMRWFPQRQFFFAGDSSYGSHELALFAQRTQGRLHLVSRFHPDANLYEPPPPYSGKGRPRVKGAKLPSPQQVVAQSERTRLNVSWYGGGRREVEVVSGVGHWYKSGVGLVAVRWVYVHDRTGTHRDEYFFSTDVTLRPQAIIERYTQRWNIETTFQESSIFRKLTVEQNILAILEAMPVCRSLKRKLTRKERWDRTDKVLEQFGLTRVRKNIAATLSGGEKRRLEIARCLVCEPLLILLDEPFTGIDPITIADIQGIVRQLRDQGIGLLLTDHNVREALKITDRSYVITDGVVEAHGTPEEIVRHPLVIAKYLGRGFAADALPHTPATERPATSVPPPGRAAPAQVSVHSLLAQEKIHTLVEKLKTNEAAAAEMELTQIGRPAIPMLLEALERRDLEMRRMAFHVLQLITDGAGPFDAYAPEAQRRQQIDQLRGQLLRRAG